MNVEERLSLTDPAPEGFDNYKFEAQKPSGEIVLMCRSSFVFMSEDERRTLLEKDPDILKWTVVTPFLKKINQSDQVATKIQEATGRH